MVHGSRSTTASAGAAPLDEVSRTALAMLWEAVIAADERTSADAHLLLQPHVAGRRHAATRGLVRLAEGVARALLRYLVGAAPGDAVERAAARLQRELGLDTILPRRDRWQAVILPTAAMIGEVALEEFGLAFDVGPRDDPDLAPIALVWRPADRAHMYVGLAGRVLQDVVAAMAGDPLVRLEHRAAVWMFDCWAAALPDDPTRAAHARLALNLRRLEWCVAGRDTVAERAPLVHTFLARTHRGEPSRLRREIARSLRDSVVALFLVRARADDLSVFEEPLTGERLHVRDHRPQTRYPPGSFALGRVFPLGDGTYVRSPGMAFYSHEDPEVMDAVKEEYNNCMRELGPEMAVEFVIGAAGGPPDVPRHVAPADSVEEAEQLMDDVWALRHRIAAKMEPPPDFPREGLAGISADDIETWNFALDLTMFAWLKALDIQAGGTARPGR